MEIYPLPRNEKESDRLNEQHRLLMQILGGPISKHIPTSNLLSVADIATGTGVWLQEFNETLAKNAARCPRYLHGFDISDTQFQATGKIDFSVQDVLKEFPEEHWSRYDLVHVRLLVGALKESEFKLAVANLVKLLKPGGYLQWVECETDSFHGGNVAEHPKFGDLMKPVFGFIDQYGLSRKPSNAIYLACSEMGLVNVVRTDHSTHEHHLPALTVQKWQSRVFTSMLPLVFLRSGQAASDEAANSMTSCWINELEKLYAEGLQPEIVFTTVVAQRPSAGHSQD